MLSNRAWHYSYFSGQMLKMPFLGCYPDIFSSNYLAISKKNNLFEVFTLANNLIKKSHLTPSNSALLYVTYNLFGECNNRSWDENTYFWWFDYNDTRPLYVLNEAKKLLQSLKQYNVTAYYLIHDNVDTLWIKQNLIGPYIDSTLSADGLIVSLNKISKMNASIFKMDLWLFCNSEFELTKIESLLPKENRIFFRYDVVDQDDAYAWHFDMYKNVFLSPKVLSCSQHIWTQTCKSREYLQSYTFFEVEHDVINSIDHQFNHIYNSSGTGDWFDLLIPWLSNEYGPFLAKIVPSFNSGYSGIFMFSYDIWYQ